MNDYYLRMKKLYKNDPKILKQLDILYDFDPTFTKFEIDVFTDKFIYKYGMKALYNAIIHDKVYLLEYPKDKLKCFLEETPSLSDVYYHASKVTEEDYKNIGKHAENLNFKTLFEFCHGKDSLYQIIETFNNKKHLENLIFISKYFPLYNLNDTTFKEEGFDEFCKLIDTRYIINNRTLSDFYMAFSNNKYLIKRIKTDQDKVKFNNYIFNYEYLYFPFYLDTYYDDRLESVKYEIDRNLPNEIIDMISNVYFGIDYKYIKNIINDATSLGLTDLKFFDFNDKYELLKFIEEHKYDSTIALDLLDNSKIESKKLLSEKLKLNYKINNNEKIKLNGQDFSFLAHKVSGLTNQKLASKIRRDPSLWGSMYDANGYISTSYITNNHIGVVSEDGFMFGFNNLNADEILQMGPTDIFTSARMVLSKRDNDYTRYMHPDELINNSFSIYNEIVLKRYNKDKKPLLPSSVISYDYTSTKDEDVSSYFNIPIYEIDTGAYFEKMFSKYRYLVRHREYKLAIDTLITIATGFNTMEYAQSMILNDQMLDEELETIITMDKDLSAKDKEILIKRFEKVKLLVDYYNHGIMIYDLEKIKKKFI